MPDKFINILSRDECISEKTMLSYLAGTLNPAERHRVERHLLECDFCNDAMEGLASESPLKTKEALDRLDSRIDGRINQKKTEASPQQWAYRIAAVIVLVSLVGGGFYYLQSIKKSEKVFAENFEPFLDTTHSILSVEPAPAEEKEVSVKKEGVATPDSKSPEKAPVQNENRKMSQQRSEEEPADIEQSDQQIASTNKLDGNKKEITTASEGMINTPAEKQSGESTGGSAQTTNQQPAAQSMREMTTNTRTANSDEALRKKTESVADQSTVVTGSAASAASNELINDGIKEYEAKNYPEAILMFNTVLEIDRSNSEALFYNGVSYMSNNQNHEAIGSLESVVKNAPNKYADAAKWYLSLVYIKEHKMSKAKNLLKELSQNKNEYQNKAKKALVELD